MQKQKKNETPSFLFFHFYSRFSAAVILISSMRQRWHVYLLRGLWEIDFWSERKNMENLSIVLYGNKKMKLQF